MNLRAKVAARANLPNNERLNQQSINNELSEDPKAFLHEYKESKREKQEVRSKEFLNRLATKEGANLSGISKSSIRRRKRKQKAELLPKMQDLLASLEDTKEDQDDLEDNQISQKYSNVNIIDKKTGKRAFVENITKNRKNLPNPRNKKGAKQIEKVETLLFNNTLKNPNFQKNPFATLKESIANRLKNGEI